MTVPMTGFTGYVTYLEFSYGSKKGNASVGDLIENPFARGQVKPDFTASKVQEGKTLVAPGSGDQVIPLEWNPVVPGTITFKIGTTNYLDDGQGHLYSYVDGASVSIVTNFVGEDVDPNNGHLEGVAGRFVKTITGATLVTGATVTYGNAATKGVSHNGVEQIYDASVAAITIDGTTGTPLEGATVIEYNYNNVAIPQNDLPIITAEMKGIALTAKARRIAVNRSAA